MQVSYIDRIKGYLRFMKPEIRAEWRNRNKFIFNDKFRPIQKNRVNLFWTGTFKGEVTEHENLGDYLSVIIVENMLKKHGMSLLTKTRRTEYLYGIGSIIGFGLQDATIWGSGLLRKENALRLVRSKLDIRAVRGPKTREHLAKMGLNCPAIYGDPAILMPMIYSSNLEKKYPCSIILHHSSEIRKNISELCNSGLHYIEIKTINYKHFIDQLIQSDMIISSALHGIILAESYGIPTIYLKDNKINQDFKFNDYYSGTGRSEYKYANTIEDALKNRPVNELPNFDEMRKKLIDTFPYDLWENYQ